MDGVIAIEIAVILTLQSGVVLRECKLRETDDEEVCDAPDGRIALASFRISSRTPTRSKSCCRCNVSLKAFTEARLQMGWGTKTLEISVCHNADTIAERIGLLHLLSRQPAEKSAQTEPEKESV